MKGFRNEPEGCRLAFMSRKSGAQARTNDSERFRTCERWSDRCECEQLNETPTKVRKSNCFHRPVARAVKRVFKAA